MQHRLPACQFLYLCGKFPVCIYITVGQKILPVSYILIFHSIKTNPCKIFYIDKCKLLWFIPNAVVYI